MRRKKIIEYVYDHIFNARSAEVEWTEWHKNKAEMIAQYKDINFEDILNEKFYWFTAEEILQDIRNNDAHFQIQKILEIGCDTGMLSAMLSRMTKCKYELTDFSEIAIKYASLVHRNEPGFVGTRVADATQLPYPDESFDFTHSVGLIEHYDDEVILRMIEEQKRVAKKSGYIYVAIPNFFGPRILKLWKRFGKNTERNITSSELRLYARKLNVKIVHIGTSAYTFGADDLHVSRRLETFLGKRIGLGFLTYALYRK